MNRPMLTLHAGDALQWLHTLPDWFVDVWITSPPYADCRTYGLNRKQIRRGESWVEWYIPYCVEMARTGRIVVINAVGPVRQHQRRDWEPVYVIGKPEAFPPSWSDNTAFGHPPKWAPGGAMSNRLSNGKRVNQWGANTTSGGQRRKNGTRQDKPRPSHTMTTNASYRLKTAAQPNGRMERQHYRPPKLANPGNVIFTKNGGNQLGSKHAHESEAPMNLVVAERFVRWYCPPGGLVGDPMCGSGTSLHAALKWGRCAIGCDIRESQIEITRRRLATVRLADIL